MNYTYVKALLYLYPKLSEIEYAMSQSVENAAVNSYRFRGDALSAAEALAESIVIQKNVVAVRVAIKEAIAELGEEEREMIAYKYFRRGKGLYASEFPPRQYYRARESALKRTAGLLASRGWTEGDYFAAFGEFRPFALFYNTVKKEEELRARRKPADQKSERCSSRSVGGRLPRRTSKAATTAATHNKQMTAICSAFNPPEALSGSSAGGSTTVTEER